MPLFTASQWLTIVLGIKFKIVHVSCKPLLIGSLFGSPVPRLASLACILATVTVIHFCTCIAPTMLMGFQMLLPPQSPAFPLINPHSPLIPFLNLLVFRENFSWTCIPVMGSQDFASAAGIVTYNHTGIHVCLLHWTVNFMRTETWFSLLPTASPELLVLWAHWKPAPFWRKHDCVGITHAQRRPVYSKVGDLPGKGQRVTTRIQDLWVVVLSD